MQHKARTLEKTNDFFALAAELGRPVSLRYLPRSHAEAALAATIFRAARLGELSGDPCSLLDDARGILSRSVRS